jgi:hypothetical protein
MDRPKAPAILQPRGFALSTAFAFLFSFLLHLLTADIGTCLPSLMSELGPGTDFASKWRQ